MRYYRSTAFDSDCAQAHSMLPGWQMLPADQDIQAVSCPNQQFYPLKPVHFTTRADILHASFKPASGHHGSYWRVDESSSTRVGMTRMVIDFTHTRYRRFQKE
jgi:hypothetical protein